MPEDNETDIGVRPTARRIGVLGRGASGRTRARGVLRSFAGVLAGRERRRARGPGPSLSYLTLEPLVLTGLGNARESDRRAASERGDSRPTDDEKRKTADPERLTVREYLRERRVDAQRRDDEPGERATSQSTPTPSGRDAEDAPEPATDAESGERSGAGDDPAPERAVPRTVVERWRGPPSATDRRPVSPGDDEGGRSRAPERGDESADGSDSRSETPPDLAVSRSADAGTADDPDGATSDDGRTAPASRSEQPRSPARQDDSTATNAGDAPPRLVVRERASPGESASDAGSGDRRQGDEAGGPSGRTGRPGRDPDVSRPATGEPDAGEGPSSDSTGRERSPLAFDAVGDPAFDRFVETLARRLDRRERVERERRGL